MCSPHQARKIQRALCMGKGQTVCVLTSDCSEGPLCNGVCMCDATHRHTITVVYFSFIWLTLASKTTNSFSLTHTWAKKKKKAHCPQMVEPTSFTMNKTAGYYFYSFKQITLASKTTDSFSLPHIHPHTYSPKTLTAHKLHC